MSEAIAAEIKEAIGKHLPQQVSDVLQERLKQADIDAATVVTQKDKLGSLVAKVSDLEANLRTANEELKKHGELAAREAAVAEKERNAEITALKVQLEASQGNTAFAKELALGLVRNSEFRRQVFDNHYTQEPIIPPGSNYQSGTATSSSNRNTTVKESTK